MARSRGLFAFLALSLLCFGVIAKENAEGVEMSVCEYDGISMCDLGINAELIVTAKVIMSSPYGFYDKCMVTAEIECIYSKPEYLVPQPKVGRNLTISGFHIDESWRASDSLDGSQWYDSTGMCNTTTADCSIPLKVDTSYLFVLSRNTWNDEFLYFPTSFDYSHTMVQWGYEDITENIEPDVFRPLEGAEFDTWSTGYDECRLCTLFDCMQFPTKENSCQAKCPIEKNETAWDTTMELCWNGYKTKDHMNIVTVIIIIAAWVFLMFFAIMIVWIIRNKRRQEKIAEGTWEETKFPWKREQPETADKKKKEEPLPDDAVFALEGPPGSQRALDAEAARRAAEVGGGGRTVADILPPTANPIHNVKPIVMPKPRSNADKRP